MTMRRRIARLFTLKTRSEVFCAIYAITLGAVLILVASLPLRRRKEPVLDQS